MNFKGKKIVVVGGGGLIGWDIVKRIIEAGGKCIALDITYRDEIKRDIDANKIGSGFLELVDFDVCEPSDVKNFFESQADIDGVVNCSYPRGKNFGADFLEVDIKDFNNTVSLHLGSALSLTQECIRYFKKNPCWFSLVNFSSIYGVIAPRFEMYQETKMTTPVEYALMKVSIQHLNKYVSSYIKDSRFRANCVSPGGILDGQPELFQDRYRGYTRGQGMLNASDIVGGVCFLLSEESRYITGQNIIIDDGFTL